MKKLILTAILLTIGSTYAASSDCVEKQVAQGFTVEQAVLICYPPRIPANWFPSF